MWVAAPILAAKIGLLLGPTGAALLAARIVREQQELIVRLIASATFVILYWASLVAVQYAQNFVYRRVGVPVQRIRWWVGDTKRSRQKKAKVRTPGR